MQRLTKRLKILQPFLLLLFALNSQQSSAQLSLDSVQKLARQNFPLIQQKGWIEKTRQLTLDNLSKGYLPQLSINAQGSYQSEVTGLKLDLPNMHIPTVSKDQYRVIADMNQLLFDGGTIRNQKALQSLSAKGSDIEVEIELFKLKQRINEIYLGILLLQEQVQQLNLVKEDLNSGISKVSAQVENGTAFRSALDLIKAESLKNEQQLIEATSAKEALKEVLALLSGTDIKELEILEKPGIQINYREEIKRPELLLLDNQAAMALQQKELVKSRILPKTSLFFQGGYGRPGLNMLKDAFDWFYIGGVRLNWSISSFYTQRQEKQLADIQQMMVDVKKQTFLLNTRAELKQQAAEINKIKSLLEKDEEIIALRTSVKQAAEAQLENGVITANDFIREVTAENLARQTYSTHQLQLVRAEINYNTLIGE